MSDETTAFPTGSGSGNPGGPGREDARRMQRVLDAHYGPRYHVDRIIGRGGMSTVWLAADGTERDVAVKVLKPELTDDAEFRARFRAEAEAAETVRSPFVVETYDYGEVPDVDGTGVTYCFIVMEYVQGESLADILARERTLPEVMALDLVTQAATGLQAIHDRGLVHRDIKPGNLMITADGIVKVTDFGIAKAASAVPLTRTGMVVGTAQYVSPEQAQGHNVGPSSDVYSLGVVGYEILAGRRPFSGDSTVSVALKHISTPPPEIPGEVSGPVRELIGICLRKDPTARYADGGELATATEQVRAGHMPPAPAALARTRAVPQVAPPVPATPAQVAPDTRLARVTDRSNMGPTPRAQRPRAQRSSAQRPAASSRARPAQKAVKKTSSGWIWLAVIVAVAAVTVLVWVLSGQFGGSGKPAPTTTTVIRPVPAGENPGDGAGQVPEETPGDGAEDTGDDGADQPTDGDGGGPTPTDGTGGPTEPGDGTGTGDGGGTGGTGNGSGDGNGNGSGNGNGGDTGTGGTGGEGTGTGNGNGGNTGNGNGGDTGTGGTGGEGTGTGGESGGTGGTGAEGGGTGGNNALPVPPAPGGAATHDDTSAAAGTA